MAQGCGGYHTNGKDVLAIKTFLLSAAALAAGAAAGIYGIGKIAHQALKDQEYFIRRLESYYEALNQWVLLKNRGIRLESYFVENQYREIAIYGFAELGNRLYEELGTSQAVKLRCIIDKNASHLSADIDIIPPSREMPRVDAIVVTATFAYNEIEKMLGELTDIPVISLEDVLYDLS